MLVRLTINVQSVIRKSLDHVTFLYNFIQGAKLSVDGVFMTVVLSRHVHNRNCVRYVQNVHYKPAYMRTYNFASQFEKVLIY